jgi:hypothetical protein
MTSPGLHTHREGPCNRPAGTAISPLVQAVRRWLFEADAWRDPETQREFLARFERYQREGPPPPEQRISREEIRAQYGV